MKKKQKQNREILTRIAHSLIQIYVIVTVMIIYFPNFISIQWITFTYNKNSNWLTNSNQNEEKSAFVIDYAANCCYLDHQEIK